MSAFDFDDARSPSFTMRFRAVAREPKSWKEELFEAARAIKSRTTKPLWICASGGLDSDVTCRAFYDQGLHFSVLTFAYDLDANKNDIRHIVAWCAERHVPHEVVPLDTQAFFSDDIDRLSERYPAIHPFRYLQLRLLEEVEQRGGFGVICSDDQLYRAPPRQSPLTSQDLFLSFSNGTAMPLQWCKDHGVDHEPYFHLSTPELALAYFRHPLNQFARAHPELIFTHRSNTHLLKKIIYQATWPDLPQRITSDGFDRVRASFLDVQDKLKSRYLGAHVPVTLSLDAFEAQLTGGA